MAKHGTWSSQIKVDRSRSSDFAAGIAETCRSMPEHVGAMLDGRHGIEGMLREELLDLSTQRP